MTNPIHDPERDAAAYLGGLLAGPARTNFETHMLGCDACWDEVSEARTGRALAEALRDAAPQSLREYLRSLAASAPDAATSPEPVPIAPDPGDRPNSAVAGSVLRRARRRGAVLLAAAAAAAAATLAVLAIGVTQIGGDPQGREASLVAAAAVFDALPQTAPPAPGAPPVRVIDGMAWQGSVRQDLAGVPAVVHRYADAAGHRVFLVSSQTQFPRAGAAKPVDAMGKNWIATINGAAMFCVDAYGLSWLVLADTDERALAAGRAAGLA